MVPSRDALLVCFPVTEKKQILMETFTCSGCPGEIDGTCNKREADVYAIGLY